MRTILPYGVNVEIPRQEFDFTLLVALPPRDVLRQVRRGFATQSDSRRLRVLRWALWA